VWGTEAEADGSKGCCLRVVLPRSQEYPAALLPRGKMGKILNLPTKEGATSPSTFARVSGAGATVLPVERVVETGETEVRARKKERKR
jgi:hypothetical protein